MRPTAAGPSRCFLVLHGWENHRPSGHWQWQLVETLRASGEHVLYPQFPDPDRPSLTAWRELLRAELAQLGPGERVVVAHSLGVSLWLHAAPLLTVEERVDRVLLVAPASPTVLGAHPEVEEFSRVRFDAGAVAAAAGSTRLVSGDGDPYCPEGAPVAYPGLTADADLVPGGRHLDMDAGYGPWPSVVAWCRDPATRLVGRDTTAG